MRSSAFAKTAMGTVLVAVSFALGACSAVTNGPQHDDGPASVGNPSAERGPAETDASAPVANPRPRPIDVQEDTVQADVIVSTNEPFWSARVEDDEVSLTGVDHPERRLPVVASEVMPHAAAMARRIHARGESVDLVIEVRAEPCQDSMSGAQYPLSASLSFDGSDPVEGCARPASMPIPPVPAD